MTFLDLILDRFTLRVESFIERNFIAEAEIRIGWVELAIERMALEALD